MSRRSKVVLAVVAATLAVVVAIAVFGSDPGPDADQREEAVMECLREADFTVRSEIPPVSRVRMSPGYEIEVSRGGDVVAYIYLFDFPEEAQMFVEDAKLDAETDDREPTIERRGATAVDLDAGARTTPDIRACIDRAAKRAPDGG